MCVLGNFLGGRIWDSRKENLPMYSWMHLSLSLHSSEFPIVVTSKEVSPISFQKTNNIILFIVFCWSTSKMFSSRVCMRTGSSGTTMQPWIRTYTGTSTTRTNYRVYQEFDRSGFETTLVWSRPTLEHRSSTASRSSPERLNLKMHSD